MEKDYRINLKDSGIIIKKKKLNLALNILISALGISSLFIIFFFDYGLLAFSFFTVDGNLFTAVVSVIAVAVNYRELRAGKESGSRRMFFLQLASAVTEAVIFIVVMIGRLPAFPDNPRIAPYHMFCLHVAIPILAVLRFIFFERPRGVLPPGKLLIRAIPIGVYGVGVITAIKLGVLPASLAPYSFLDFENNFLYYFLFALVGIPSFGYLWSWLFYRQNIRASLVWYSSEDLAKLKAERIKQLSSFEAVNSSILLLYCALAVLVITFATMGTSKTAQKVQNEMMTYMGYYMNDDYDHMLGDGYWSVRDGALYKGELYVGDGTEANYNREVLPREAIDCEASIFVQAKDLAPELAKQYDPYDYVSVNHSPGVTAPVQLCGETLDREIVTAIIESEDHRYYEEFTVDGVSYFRCCQTFGRTMLGAGVGIVSLSFPSAKMTTQIKNAQLNSDIMITGVVIAAFAVLYVLTAAWIRTLEKSVDFLKAITSGRVPDEPIKLGRTLRHSGLEHQLNVLREINKE